MNASRERANPLRITFESAAGPLVVEFSRELAELALVTPEERIVVTGERAREIARKVIELCVLCSVATMGQKEAQALGVET